MNAGGFMPTAETTHDPGIGQPTGSKKIVDER
jgi:hypothetical protein